jgi:hypothetical protein
MERLLSPYYIKNILKHGPDRENPRNEAQRVNFLTKSWNLPSRGGIWDLEMLLECLNHYTRVSFTIFYIILVIYLFY